MAYELVILGLIVVLVLVAISYINRIRVLSNRIENAWAQIDVQLKKRADLVPNLVETVKGYMKHEKAVFKDVTDARKAMMSAETPEAKAKAGNVLAGALKSILAIAENYPKLKANQNFMMLQEELSGTESKIAYARQFYNDTVLKYDNMREKFPSNIVASMFNFAAREYFEVGEAEREPVKVKF